MITDSSKFDWMFVNVDKFPTIFYQFLVNLYSHVHMLEYTFI